MTAQTSGGRHWRIPRSLRVVTIAVTVGVVLWVAVFIALVRAHAPIGFDGDESHHATWGAAIYLDLARSDLGGFLRHSYAQNRFAPLYSYLQAPMLAILGITPFAHRLVGVLFLVLLCGSVYLCVVWSRPGPNAWVGGCLAALLVIACPALLSTASRVYFEPASLALMMLTYALYLRARSTQSTRWAWGAGLLHLLSWFLKWQFGILISIALVIHLLWIHYPRLRRITSDQIALRALLPAWVAVGLWMVNPYQFRACVLYLTQCPRRQMWQEIITSGLWLQLRFIFAHYSATIPVGVLTVAAFIYGLIRRNTSACSLLVISTLVTVATNMHLLGGAEERVFMWMLPPLWVLTGIALNEGLSRLEVYAQKWPPRSAQTVTALLVILLLISASTNAALGLRQGTAKTVQGSPAQLWDVLDYIVETVPPGRRIAVVGCWIRGLSPWQVNWAYLARFGPAGLGYDDLQLWDYPPPDPNAQHILHFRWPWRIRLPAQQPAPQPDAVAVLQRADIDAIVVCSGLDESFAPERQAVQAAISQLGFREAGEFGSTEWGQHVIVYLR